MNLALINVRDHLIEYPEFYDEVSDAENFESNRERLLQETINRNLAADPMTRAAWDKGGQEASRLFEHEMIDPEVGIEKARRRLDVAIAALIKDVLAAGPWLFYVGALPYEWPR